MAFDMSDYVDVRHRLELALLQYPDLRVIETEPQIVTMGERVYIQCAVTVYRSHDDPTPGRAYCWEVWPGRTPYTKDSEQMNGATSALGRALGYMGFGIKSGLASADEVRTAQGNSHPATQPSDTPRRPIAGNNSRPASSNSGGTITGLASSKQIDLIATMRKERNLDAWDATDKTFNDASDEITRLKGIPR